MARNPSFRALTKQEATAALALTLGYGATWKTYLWQGWAAGTIIGPLAAIGTEPGMGVEWLHHVTALDITCATIGAINPTPRQPPPPQQPRV